MKGYDTMTLEQCAFCGFDFKCGQDGIAHGNTGEPVCPKTKCQDGQDAVVEVMQMAKVIVSRAGHGGARQGAVYKDTKEKDLTLQVDAAFTNALSRKYTGFRQIRIRTTDVDVPLAQNGIIASREGADVYIEFHFNAGGGTGPETYIHNSNATAHDRRLAQIIQSGLFTYLKQLGLKDRGIKAANFQSLRETAGIPSCLVEILFLDNEVDRVVYLSPGFIEKVGEVLADGVAEFLGLPAAEKPADRELEIAVQYLVAAGIINSPEYWLQHAKPGDSVAGEFAAILIKRVAAKMKEAY
jgi:N-acetylmuramoyl-L-alanine amidase